MSPIQNAIATTLEASVTITLSIICRPSLHKAIVQPGAVDGPLVVDPGH